MKVHNLSDIGGSLHVLKAVATALRTTISKRGFSGSSIVMIVLLCRLMAAPALAQTANTGALAGEVFDPTHALVPDAKVTITSESTGEKREVLSRRDGSYVVPLLPPGSYRVEFSKAGFKAAVKKGLQIIVTETARLDIQLSVGGAQEVVTVESRGEQLQTESTNLGQVTSGEVLNSLPLVPNAAELGRPA